MILYLSMDTEILKRWGEEHGHYNAPKTATVTLDDGVTIYIGKWLGKQRSLRRGNDKKSLRHDRFEMLDELARTGKFRWAYTMDSNKRWNLYFESLVHLANSVRGGDCNVPRNEKITGDEGLLRIGAWLHKQRENYHLNRLNSQYKEKLQALVDQGKLTWECDTDYRQPRSHAESESSTQLTSTMDHQLRTITFGNPLDEEEYDDDDGYENDSTET